MEQGRDQFGMKRVSDSLLALILVMPISIICVALGVINSVLYHTPPFYFQGRIGRNGRSFTCIKLKSMLHTETEADVNDKVRDAERVTPLGLWLRNRGLDELPQVWNILVGQMSFVGPRPLLAKNVQAIKDKNEDHTDAIEKWAALRQTVRPGMSGWHQVHSLGPNIVEYDTDYMNNPSLKRQLVVFACSVIIMAVGKRRYFGLQ
jgi:lipopolysaccharide/colanic/teichoic acid biosynthesis glycosyltransferase